MAPRRGRRGQLDARIPLHNGPNHDSFLCAGMLNAFTHCRCSPVDGTRFKAFSLSVLVGLVGAGILAFQPGMGSELGTGITWGTGLLVLQQHPMRHEHHQEQTQ